MTAAEPQSGRWSTWWGDNWSTVLRRLVIGGTLLALHLGAGAAWSIPISVTYLLVVSQRTRDLVRRVPFLLPAILLTWVAALAQPIRDAAQTPAGQTTAHALGGIMPPIPWGWLRAVAII